MNLHDRLPESASYSTDAYEVYKWLPANWHTVGKGVRRTEMKGCTRC